METINIEVILDKVFGKSCDSIAGDDEIYAELKRRKANKPAK
nr:MAG: hypothetical protein [Bacteriophage sp.]